MTEHVPQLPENEEARLRTLQNLEILDTPIDHNFEKITRLAKKMFDAPIVAISLIDKNRQWFKSIQGADVKETPRSESVCSYTILQDEPLFIEDLSKHPTFKDFPMIAQDPHVRSYLGCPISMGNSLNIGTLCIVDYKPRKYTEQDISCLKELAHFIEDEISTHVNNFVVNYENKLLTNELSKLQRVAAIDPLTQIWNRVGIKKFFENVRNKCLRTNTQFALGLIDMDGFKFINDQYGHNAGDATLKHMATILVNAVRQMDTVGRWGGDEFLIILDTPEEDKIREIFERIKHSIKNSVVSFEEHSFPLSATIGVTICEPTEDHVDDELEAILTRADQSLYEGKKSGEAGQVIYYK